MTQDLPPDVATILDDFVATARDVLGDTLTAVVL
jgi:hypothetical protein